MLFADLTGAPREELLEKINQLDEDLTKLKVSVTKMREAQQGFFRDKSPQWLSEAKKLEREVDDLLHPDQQQRLF